MPEIVESEFGTTVQEATFLKSTEDPNFLLGIVELSSEQAINISRAIQSVSVSFSMDLCPQVTVQLFDVNMKMLENNYFNVGREFVYKSSQYNTLTKPGMKKKNTRHNVAAPNLGESELEYNILMFELTSVSVSPGQGSSPSITLELRSRSVMQMKRDRKPGSITGKGHVFVQQAARAYGITSYTETTQKDKKINKASTDKRADSLWDVLSSLASEAKFSIFEIDGILVFASMRNLYGRWGPEQFVGLVYDEKTNKRDFRLMNSWYVNYPYESGEGFLESRKVLINGLANDSELSRLLVPLQCPTFRRSDSDIYQVEGSMSLDRHNAMVLRPGMTIYVDGVPTFEDFYLITEVSFEHMSTNPVQISFKKPEREDKNIIDIPIGFINSGGVGTGR
jgi:GTPase SAR1 family protein